ncbi:hypothetical protein V490_00089 [Pseudogymnoascus sp. VKM F-3557]|nr:hypothetical protein V490_00089 [Pseudogymnoascus sp. VKM F-3557]
MAPRRANPGAHTSGEDHAPTRVLLRAKDTICFALEPSCEVRCTGMLIDYKYKSGEDRFCGNTHWVNPSPPTSERIGFSLSTRCRAVSTLQKGYRPHCVYSMKKGVVKAVSAKKTQCSARADQDSRPLTKLRGRVSTDPPNRRSLTGRCGQLGGWSLIANGLAPPDGLGEPLPTDTDEALWTTGWMVSHRRWSRTTRWSR